MCQLKKKLMQPVVEIKGQSKQMKDNSIFIIRCVRCSSHKLTASLPVPHSALRPTPWSFVKSHVSGLYRGWALNYSEMVTIWKMKRRHSYHWMEKHGSSATWSMRMTPDFGIKWWIPVLLFENPAAEPFTCLCINENGFNMRPAVIRPSTDYSEQGGDSERRFGQRLMNGFHLDEVQCTALCRIHSGRTALPLRFLTSARLLSKFSPGHESQTQNLLLPLPRINYKWTQEPCCVLHPSTN